MTHPMSALVVEDEWPARNYLVELLRESGAFGEIVAVATAQAAREVLLGDEVHVEVAFVDIRLVDVPGDTSGLSLARALGRLARPPLLVLATALPGHALEGFDLGAVDYLLKPFRPERLQQCVERLHQRRGSISKKASQTPGRLVARNRQGLMFLDWEGLLAFEASGRLSYVHHTDGVYNVDLSLSALNAALGERVLRVHRNWLVAPEHVQELRKQDGALSLRVGEDLLVPVARDRAKQVRQQLLSSTLGLRSSGE